MANGMEHLKINIASFEDGDALQKAFLDVVRKEEFKLSDLTGENNLEKVVGLALQANSDRALNNALWPCLAMCTYKGEKITKSTFEDVEVRKLYFAIVAKCIQVNVEPFIGGLSLVLGLFSPQNPLDTQK